MNKIIYILSLSLCFLGTAQTAKKLTYNAASGWKTTTTTSQSSEERQVGSFNKIYVSGPFYVTLEKSPPGTIQIDASKKLLEEIETKVTDGQLIIKFKRNKISRVITSKINIRIPVEKIDQLKLSGSGQINSKFKLNTAELYTSLSGSGKIALDVTAAYVSGKLSGSGKLILNGGAEKVNFQLSGSGKIDANALESQEANIKLSGSGRIHVYVQEMIESKISGSGVVKYKSDRQETRVYSVVNGSGRLIKKME